jgi:hypothetical protein
MLKELLIENTPKYTQILPFSQTRVTYRPFVVREEKSLMISKETAGFEDLMMTIRNVINNCTTNLPNDDCKNLPFCDLEYLFIKINEFSKLEIRFFTFQVLACTLHLFYSLPL